MLRFSIGKDDTYIYIISFSLKEKKSFIYDVVLKKGHKYLKYLPNIVQETIDYQDKLDLFIEALKENKEENKMKELFQEIIELYSKKKGFSFLISLFVKVYQEKDLCNILIQNFYDMNMNIKGNEKETLSDLIFSEECEISPETILIKEIKTSNNKYLYKKYLNIKVIKIKKKKKKC